MSWERYDDSGTRWSREADDVRHLLLFDTASGELRELHEVPDGPVTVHVYERPLNVVNDAAPLDGARHLRTVELSPEDGERLRTLNDSKVFEYLEIGKTW